MVTQQADAISAEAARKNRARRDFETKLNSRIFDQIGDPRLLDSIERRAADEAKKYIMKLYTDLEGNFTNEQAEAWFDGFYDGYCLANGITC